MFFSLVLLLLPSTIYVHATCQPFYTTFASLEGFTPMDSPRQYSFSDDGLELYMRKPRGPVKSSKGVNDKVGEGATFNSTFVMSQGKATFEVTAPKVAGLVTAVVMISTGDSGDEIDIELLGGDPDHWQTNIYAPPYPGAPPEYGTYSSIEDVGDIGGMHAYTIDWNEERIQWSLDGRVARTLTKAQTFRKGRFTYPTHEMRLQLGIWDASGAPGTAAWANGPVNWEKTPDEVKATIRSVRLECGV